MRARIAAAAGLAALALGGCGSAAGGTSDTGTPAETADCGKVSLGQGESTIPAAPLQCLADASAAGSPATLAVLALTVEGDVITTTYTVVDTRRVRMIVDSTQDAFAGDGAGITQQTCDLGTDGGQITVTNCTDPEPF
ncbi:MAG: DUF4362 domain-containing protein [Candidatus Nanopelagicales bacterium]